MSRIVRHNAWIIGMVLLCAAWASAQDRIESGTGTGIEKQRLAQPKLPLSGANDEVASTFNAVLWNDLQQAGIFEMISRSFYPLGDVSQPGAVKLDAWRNQPCNAGLLVFGNVSAAGSSLSLNGWLYDVINSESPQILAKQYRGDNSVEGARQLAHQFANDIISRMGGGINSITQTKIYFVRGSNGHKEIWEMDYDGANQHPVTAHGSISLGPKPSPDGGRVAYASFASGAPQIYMFSVEIGRNVSFAKYGGFSSSPAWMPDGQRLVFSSSMGGHPNLYMSDLRGGGVRRLTVGSGPDMSPTVNPKSGAQIAFCSGRTGLPQIYIMGADGSAATRVTNEGYAVSPAWSPDGQYLAFAWIRHYGPGAPGAQDIYLYDIANHKWVQLTHGGGRNDSPSWSPDGRHIVFQSNRSGTEQVYSMLADGSQLQQLTFSGVNSEPAWSVK